MWPRNSQRKSRLGGRPANLLMSRSTCLGNILISSRGNTLRQYHNSEPTGLEYYINVIPFLSNLGGGGYLKTRNAHFRAFRVVYLQLL